MRNNMTVALIFLLCLAGMGFLLGAVGFMRKPVFEEQKIPIAEEFSFRQFGVWEDKIYFLSPNEPALPRIVRVAEIKMFYRDISFQPYPGGIAIALERRDTPVFTLVGVAVLAGLLCFFFAFRFLREVLRKEE